MQIQVSSGVRYARYVWTFAYLAVARATDQQDGDNLRGTYLLPPDLFVATLDRTLVAAVITQLIQHDRLRAEWRIPEDTTNVADGETSPVP